MSKHTCPKNTSPPTEPTIGIVVNCMTLNIRNEPNPDATVLCKVPALSELMIDDTKSTKDWASVCTATGLEGFCMKKYVAVRRS